jgi:hypothetical protein
VSTGDWVALVILTVLVIFALAMATGGEDRWKTGHGYRCNYVDPAGRQCELDHLHVADFCVTHDKYGGLHEWKGLNWEWDDQEKVYARRPESWKGLS